jgi:membrane fusion protein (multidrug efflux system)
MDKTIVRNKNRRISPVHITTIILVCSMTSLLFFDSCKTKKKVVPAAPEYSVLEIVPRPATLFSDYPATIQGQQNVEIRPKVDGFIEIIYVDEGSTVKKGQLLFRIKAPQYEQEVRTAQADILIAQADVDAAQMQVNKVQPLVEKNIISKYELESAQYALKSRQAALAQARAKLANAQTNLGYTAISSPANGVIGAIPYKMGSLVSANTPEPLTTVSNIENIYVYFSVNEKTSLDFSKNAKGATIKERLTTLPPVSLILSNGSEFSEKGTIDAASGLINTETGSLNVRATFRNPGSIIRSGSSGTIRIPQHVDSALLIPQKVTYEIQGKKFVYVLDSSGTVRSVEISILNGGNGQYFVVQKGLQPGDRIVIEGVETLREGLAIKPRVANADSIYREIYQ